MGAVHGALRPLTLVLILLLVPWDAAAQSPPWREGPIRDVQIRGYNNQRCGRAHNRIIQLRATRGNIPIHQGDSAIFQLTGPLPTGARSPVRKADSILSDTGGFVVLEETTGHLSGKRDQIEKDTVLVSRGGLWNGGQFRPKTVVYFISYIPSDSVQRDLTRRGLAYYDYLSGANNFDALPAARRPSVRLQRTIFLPLELPPIRLSNNRATVAAKGLAFVDAAVVVYGLYSEIRLGMEYADKAREVREKLQIALEQVQTSYPRGTTFWVRVTFGGEKVGPLADACRLPTLTKAYVKDLGPRPCRPGDTREVHEDYMASPNMVYVTHDTCLEGVGTPPRRDEGPLSEAEDRPGRH